MNAPRTQHMRGLVLLVVGLVGLTMAGRAWAGFAEGAAAWGNQDYATALQEFLASAHQGDAASQYMLCNMYRHGQGVSEDYPLAVQWCHKAAEKGNSEAQLSLGVIYLTAE